MGGHLERLDCAEAMTRRRKQGTGKESTCQVEVGCNG